MISAATEFHTAPGIIPDSALATRLGTRGARSWSREDTQACSCKVLLRIGKSLLWWQRCSYTGGNRNPSEAAKHCLHDGRIVPRGANQLRNPGLFRISEYNIGGFLANHVDRADNKVAGDARKNRSVYYSQTPCSMHAKVAA